MMTILKKGLLAAIAILLMAHGLVTEVWAGANKGVIRLAIMGDIMLGTENMLPEDGAAKAFAAVSPYLHGRHVVIGNLEGPLTDRGAPSKVAVEGVSYIFRTPPHYVERLREAGFTIMSMANNHANDYGPAGHEQTREVLDQAGILYTGAPGQVARQKVGRGTVSVIGLAPNSGCQNLNDIPAAVEMVRQEAARPNTLVVVTFHGGAEGEAQVRVPQGPETFLGENRGDLRRLGRALIDAGAHLVVGHGPHVPRGMEIYKDRLIAYSLGNFVTGKGLGISGRKGLAPLLLVDISRKGVLVGGQVISFRQNQAGQASPDPDAQAVKLMHSLSLADFDQPGLGLDGRIMTTGAAALELAAASGSQRDVAVAARSPKPAEEASPAPAQLAQAPAPDGSKAAELKSEAFRAVAEKGFKVSTVMAVPSAAEMARGPSRPELLPKASELSPVLVGYEWDIYREIRRQP